MPYGGLKMKIGLAINLVPVFGWHLNDYLPDVQSNYVQQRRLYNEILDHLSFESLNFVLKTL